MPRGIVRSDSEVDQAIRSCRPPPPDLEEDERRRGRDVQGLDAFVQLHGDQLEVGSREAVRLTAEHDHAGILYRHLGQWFAPRGGSAVAVEANKIAPCASG